jgi:hypothetical protein
MRQAWRIISIVSVALFIAVSVNSEGGSPDGNRAVETETFWTDFLRELTWPGDVCTHRIGSIAVTQI